MNFLDLQKENKLLMSELSQLNLKTPEGIERRRKIIDQLNSNNADLQAIAGSLGDRDQMPRLFMYKQDRDRRNGNKKL